MFRSIRWRLVASYALLTLLTVSVLGLLAVSLVERYADQQQRAALQGNAETVAQQALPLFHMGPHPPLLRQLVGISAFLGNARVRILTTAGEPLADSGPRPVADEFVWLTPQQSISAMIEAPPIVMTLPSGQTMVMPALAPARIPLEGGPGVTEIAIVRRSGSAWGERFQIETQDVIGLEEVEALPDELLEAGVIHESAPWEVMAVSESFPPPDPQALRVVVPVGDPKAPVGQVELSVGDDPGAETLAAFRQALLWAGAGALLMAVLVGLLVSRSLSAPLQSLALAADQMSRGTLSARAHLVGHDEIGQVAAQFNTMAARLEASFAALAAERDALRRFVADASHELRTPITVLKSFNELLQGAASHDATARAEFLAESEAQIQRLEWITRNLLDLSRLDGGLVALDLADHDAQEVIEAVVAPLRPLAQERGVMLSVAPVVDALVVHADRARLEMALTNLLDNALKFTPANGAVTLGAEATSDGEAVALWVADTGPGIPADEQARIFDRFFRSPTSQAPGSGLGLAIVQSIAEAHHGAVTVQSELGAGSRFTLTIPAHE